MPARTPESPGLPATDAVRAIVLLCLLTLLSVQARAAEPWPTARFQVFVGAPYTGETAGADIENLDVPADSDDRPHPRAIEDVERALSEAAQWYRKKGFPAPNLGLMVDTAEGPAYRVYLCKNTHWALGGFKCGYKPPTPTTKATTSMAGFVPRCGNDPTRSRYLFVNWEVTIGDTLGLNEGGYQSIAHELMHAIIDNTPLGTPSPCNTIGGWITEGLPDAISYDLAEEVWVPQNRYRQGTKSTSIIKRYGYRPYVERLPQRGNLVVPGGKSVVQGHYGTSSFWRYLADSHPDGWAMLLTKKPGAAPGLLDIPMRGEPGWQREVKWLEQGLRGKFNRGLDEMYALFVNQFAYRVAPMESYAGKPAEDNLAHWAELLFGKCASIDLSTAARRVVPLDLEPLASRCIWVEPTNAPGFTQITFSAESQKLQVLKDIWIGQAGTARVVRALVAPAPNLPGWSVASWRDYPQDGAKRRLYVVSNAARDPAASEPRSINLEVTRAGHSNSLWVGPEQPPPVAPVPMQPTYDKHARSLARQQRDTARQVSEQMALDKESLNPNASGSTDISRFRNTPPCPEPFRYAPCGPHLAISLTLVPGTYAAPGGANAQGGIAAQAMGGLQAMSQSSLFGTEETIKRLQARIDSIDGSAVRIAIPMIDYGFSGTIDNAAIHIDMAGGKTLSAFGPPDASGNTPLTGKVTIQAFTPLFISGSFTAPLAEFLPNGEQPPLYRRRETVTGSFSSVAPWMSDERVQVEPESTERMADDIANSLGISPQLIHSMKQEGSLPGGGSAAGGGTGAAARTDECSCECDYRPFADELCELFCEEEFAACDGR